MTPITYPDPPPFKLRVLRALTAAFKEITPANGYQFDLSDFTPDDGTGQAQTRVFRGRAWYGDHDPIPMLSILEGTNPADEISDPPANVATGAYDWALLVQGFVDDDPVNPTDPAYVLEADVRRRLAVEALRRHPIERFPDPFGMGQGRANRVEAITIGAGVVRPADDISSRAYFWVPVTLHLIESAAEPYA